MEVSHDYLFKLILLGDSGVGKTSLIHRYTDNTYSKDTASTIGVDFKIKTIKVEDKVVKLQIWDTAGQERFRTIIAHYYRGANGILLVFDLTNHESFENLKEWMGDLEKRDLPKDTDIRILGNKVDCKKERSVWDEEIASFMVSHEIPMENYCEVSAQDDINVEKVFFDLTKKLIKTCKNFPSAFSSKVAFKVEESPRSSRCC